MRAHLALAGLLVVCAACASGGSVSQPMGAFFAADDGTGVVVPLDQGIAASLDDPADTIVIVYNHGTDWGGRFQDCVPSSMPGFLKSWAQRGLDGHRVVVLYLCSQKVENRAVMGKARSIENVAVLDRLIAAGVAPRNIFLFGHSGGASTSLLVAARAPETFNSAVVSAPGYGYAWLDAEGESHLWMAVEYDKWRSGLSRARDMSALVFLFEGDTWAPPGDAQFLAALPDVEVITVRDVEPEKPGLCVDEPEAHFYWWSACFRTVELAAVEAFMLDRLAHRAWLP